MALNFPPTPIVYLKIPYSASTFVGRGLTEIFTRELGELAWAANRLWSVGNRSTRQLTAATAACGSSAARSKGIVSDSQISALIAACGGKLRAFLNHKQAGSWI